MLDDVLAPGLRVVFCGINPGLYTAWAGHHFARPGNRFWKALHLAGFTPRLLHPSEQRQLLELGLGITNLVPRTTARADELSMAELQAGAQELRRKLDLYQPNATSVPTPVIMYVHGGGWASGSKAEEMLWLLPYLQAGWAGVIRQSPQHGAKLKEFFAKAN